MKPPRKFKTIEEVRGAVADRCAAHLERRTGRAWSPELRAEVRAALESDAAYEADRKVAAKLLRAVKVATERTTSPDMDEEFRQFVVDQLAPLQPMFAGFATVPLRRDERARLVQRFDAPADVGGFLNSRREAMPRDLACLHILVSEHHSTIAPGKLPDPVHETIRREAETMRKTRARYGLPTCPPVYPEGSLSANILGVYATWVRREKRSRYIARLYRGPATGGR